MFQASEVLGEDGPFVREIEGFAPRHPQQLMADAVARALNGTGVLTVEAGTGVGKTFAYLVPALLSGRKVIISTGTKNLQDQLFNKDLPLVQGALGAPQKTALLKGRANYLCLLRLEMAREQNHGRRHQKDLSTVAAWARRTGTGDLAEVPGLPEDSPIWVSATSTAENCQGQDCPSYDECFVFQARRKAQEADLVVINHHLLFADMSLKEEGFGDLLPASDAIIIDEAHQLPDIAPQFFGQSLTSRQLMDLARDSIGEQIKEAGDMPGIPAAAEDLEKASRDLRLAFGQASYRAPWKEVAGKERVTQAMDTLKRTLTTLRDALESAAQRGKGLEGCFRRAQSMIERMGILDGKIIKKVAEQMVENGADEAILDAPPKPSPRQVPPEAESAQNLEGYIHWFETFNRGFAIYLTPLNIAELFSGHMQTRKAAWVFTSATLAIGERFDHFASQLGLVEAETLHLDSPFDYPNNALMYLPQGLPEPNERDFHEVMLREALPLLEANKGRAFMLFTSHRALQMTAERLERRGGFNLFVQGSASKDALLSAFRKTENAILLGTSSFWEGVDVRGQALSLVIIDKLPFASPGDPVLQARIEALRKAGANPFMDYQLPNAVIALKQGAGRLIRDGQDRGVLMLCDPRLTSKRYGRVFLDSLPAMARTRDSHGVLEFLGD